MVIRLLPISSLCFRRVTPLRYILMVSLFLRCRIMMIAVAECGQRLRMSVTLLLALWLIMIALLGALRCTILRASPVDGDRSAVGRQVQLIVIILLRCVSGRLIFFRVIALRRRLLIMMVVLLSAVMR